MKKTNYYIVDVFTDQPFGGNQLAVFPNGHEVPETYMQKIAREFNFSETTFVLPPKNHLNDFQLRIFTPYQELPMAGHPTVGSAFALRENGYIPAEQESIVIEEGIGDITVSFQNTGNKLITTMQQPLPLFGATFEREIMAKILSLEKDQVVDDYPIQVVSSGVPFLYVPLRDLSAIKSIKLKMDLYEKYLAGFPSNNLFVFTTETERPGSTIHSRMFAPGFGIPEDPATGGASGPAGAYLVKYGIADAGNPIISEQGFEMGRPSIVHIGIKTDHEGITGVTVGGEARLFSEGIIFIP